MTRTEQSHDEACEDSTDSGASDRRDDGDVSRRSVMQTAAAGVAATGLGTVATGSAAASTQEEGPGQDIATPKLDVDGNVLVDPDGDTVRLRGLNVADPKKLDLTASVRGKTAEQAIRYVTNQDEGWYPRVIRLPVEPGNVAELTPVPIADDADLENGDYPLGAFDESDLEDYCENHLDDAIDLCAERNVYVLLDYHRHWGGGSMQWNDNPELEAEVDLFWDFMAERYGDVDHVLFELYNEPTEPGMWGDPANDHWAGYWFDWVETAQPWLETIREHTDTVVFIGSPGWTTSPEGALLTPETTPDYLQDDFQQFEDPEDNIGFTYHIYPAHEASQGNAWDDPSANGEGVDEVYEEYPLFVTEFGWDGELDGTYTHSDPFFPLEGTTDGFGEPFMEWLEDSDGISWTAWCADPIWKPVMMERTFTERTQFDDVDTAGDVYNEELPVYCEEPPCEWGVLGDDVGDYDQKMGGFIKDSLAEYRDDDVPGPVEPTAPSAPSGLEVTTVGETSVEVSWSPVADADHYNVSLAHQDGYVETTDTSYEFDGLEPDTTYEIDVWAENDVGTSATVTIEVTTGDGGGDGGCPVGEAETLSNGNTVCDIDGDGKYRDLTASGDTTTQDLQYFFEHQHREPYDSRTDLFDYTDNDNVGQPDVVDLFHAI